MEAIIEAALDLATNPIIVALGSITIVEIVPIKLKPWTALLRWMGRIMNGDLKKEVTELKQDFENTKANGMRWEILSFANGCRHKRKHTKEEWNHVITRIKEYETYVEEKGIDNGVIEEESKYLRELYHDISMKNDFLL